MKQIMQFYFKVSENSLHQKSDLHVYHTRKECCLDVDVKAYVLSRKCLQILLKYTTKSIFQIFTY